jgi:hypothetical protein
MVLHRKHDLERTRCNQPSPYLSRKNGTHAWDRYYLRVTDSRGDNDALTKLRLLAFTRLPWLALT